MDILFGVDLSENDSDYTVQVENRQEHVAPYIITEEEFGEIGNEEITLILYSDSVLASEDDEIISDPESLIGDTLKDFDNYEETMYVRNENTETDYIIIRSEKSFDDIISEENN